MRLFRIDNRDFTDEDVILPQDAYQSQLSQVKAQVEQVLEGNRPENKPRRNEILMLFGRFEDASKHWTIQSGSKFYKVEVEDEDVLHVGDYNKIEELFNNINNLERANEIAIEYWEGLMTANPKPEYFVNEAPVYRIISVSDKERKNAYSIRGNFDPIPGVRIVVDID